MSKGNDIPFEAIAAVLSGNADASLASFVELWRQASPDNDAEYLRLSAIWRDGGKAASGPMPVFDTEKAWQKVNARISHRTAALARPRKFKLMYYAAAAVLLLAISLSIFLMLPRSNEDFTALYAGNDSILSAFMPDSSAITLNRNAVLRWSQDYGRGERRVQLNGEAFFDVRKSSTPFIVETPAVAVVVTGTAFSLNSYTSADSALLKVSEGSVVFYPRNGKPFFVNAGMQAKWRGTDGNTVLEPIHEKNAFAWKTKTLVFERTELREVVRVLTAVYGRNIEIQKQHTGDCMLTATFYDESLDSVLQIISETLNLKLSYQNGTYYFGGDSCR